MAGATSTNDDLAPACELPAVYDVSDLRQQLQQQHSELAELNSQFLSMESDTVPHHSSISYQLLKDNKSQFSHHTGFPDTATFTCVLDFASRFSPLVPSRKTTLLSTEDQLLITLMKLRHNFTHKHLALLFNLGTATITYITSKWIDLLHELLFVGIMHAGGIPSRQKNLGSMPKAFESFQGARITLDCTEIQCAVPRGSMCDQSATFSHYKQRNTFKALLGVAPNGTITFVSELYPGSTSDKQIVVHSKVLDQMVPGDLVLADKGFLLHDILPQGVSASIPPFLTTQQFTKEQVAETTRIARACIHVERAIQRLKIYKILSLIPASYRPKATKICQVCACLANFQSPVIQSTYSNPS